MTLKPERLAWIAAVSILIAMIIIVDRRLHELQHSFLVGPDQRKLADQARVMLMKDEHISSNEVDRYFYTSFSYFSNEICIRFVPRPGVLGGATSYCFDTRNTDKLLRIDKSA